MHSSSSTTHPPCCSARAAEKRLSLVDLGPYHGNLRLKGDYRDSVLGWEGDEKGEKKERSILLPG
jgi:hypothetical protein